ncbi:MAG TPA: DUF1634 domain-containing protein [Ktedonobacteraceae bacterium]
MDKYSSSQLLTVTARAESQPVVEISQDDQKKTIHTKEYTSSIIGWVLRGGVILSATIILIGFILLLVHLGEKPGFAMSIGAFPHTLGQVWSGLLVLYPQAIIATGLLFLIVTPVITVTTSLVAFAVERDRRFVFIACVVLAILISSMLIGKSGG